MKNPTDPWEDGKIPWAPKPTLLDVSMVNNLVFSWPKPLFFMVSGAHGIYIYHTFGDFCGKLAGKYTVHPMDPIKLVDFVGRIGLGWPWMGWFWFNFQPTFRNVDVYFIYGLPGTPRNALFLRQGKKDHPTPLLGVCRENLKGLLSGPLFLCTQKDLQNTSYM